MSNICYGIVFITLCYCVCAQVGERCVLSNTGQEGVCSISSDCPEVEEQARRGLSPTICGFYQLTIPIVCCERSNDNYNYYNANQQRPSSNSFLAEDQDPDSISFPDDETSLNQGYSTNSLSKSEQKCLEYSKPLTAVVQAIPLVTNTDPININIEKCNYNSVALIVGGKPATASEFPFMAALGFYLDGVVEWKCGATLISDRYVLTAAHCTFSRDADAPKVIRLGDLDLSRTDDSEHADYQVGKIIVHPNYRFPQKYNDIALIQSRTKIRFTKYIRPACLHTKKEITQTTGTATGWGKTDYAEDSSNKLMKVSLNIYSNRLCSQTYGVNKNIPDGIASTMLCAGELKGGKDTCQGDSGGPLVVTKKENQCKFYVVGVTSFGKSCGQVRTPAVYTRVSEFVSWIEQNIW